MWQKPKKHRSFNELLQISHERMEQSQLFAYRKGFVILCSVGYFLEIVSVSGKKDQTDKKHFHKNEMFFSFPKTASNRFIADSILFHHHRYEINKMSLQISYPLIF